ncbi:MAG: dependent oxidoreductase [Solirubrobacterales bacterium]|jgi:2-polyprenyl-6-methoxyphenol hydroxylase-like FAD-dependent oxidoreductase|nr:dependent oxidoreductase [Solirubrobacterales bacterium]
MARVVVLGAGVCGLGAALMLRRDGHDVAVLERDPAPVPDSNEGAWERWERAGVTQFRQAHFLQPLGRIVLDEELPDVRDALLAAGAARFDPLRLMPPWIADRRPRPGDERFATITARRPVMEHAFARVAQEEVDVRRGIEVERLLTNGVPRIAGVRTTRGEELPADLVVDAMGRRSRLPAWLADAGARGMHEESEDFGFLYYTRFFRGEQPRMLAPLLTAIGTISLLTLPGDDDTWSVTVLGAAGDRPLKRLRKTEAWTAVVRACPLQAHWLEGEPITEILGMGGIVDRYRRLVSGSRPAVTGVALLGDACACTNPSLGRGIALGLRHAQLLRDTLREEEEPGRFAEAWDAATEVEITPWYRATARQDRERLREIDALRQGLERPAPADRQAAVRAALTPAAMCDPDVLRAMLAERCCLDSPTALDEPELAERILELARDAEPAQFAGPDRKQLLTLLA